MSADPIRAIDAKAWLVKAQEDLAIADLARMAEKPVTYGVVFHAQQAAEKALKGFLAWHDRPFRKTHNLLEIGKACREIDPSLWKALAGGRSRSRNTPGGSAILGRPWGLR